MEFHIKSFCSSPSLLITPLISHSLLKPRQLKYQRPTSASGNMTTDLEVRVG
ncbi:hypothetical protein M422DRAFT_253294 [Sphaerobolus stellatus SS14]|uniref:Uncharacterized protein n=1 Tax=Sphaerobolus stellatus (strain SS14) TaxID=990650 RepID=A0A0C9UK77_SPHS4|nr:hypothetical protein M422DRAFT_253294 [Sphaerobolus stellatus SS14]